MVSSHGNSINKNDDGDFLLSARFTDAVYKISGQNGKILWRLGGTTSDFELENFNFSRQHDAHWLTHDSDKEIITILDNSADNHPNGISPTSNTSSAMVILLDKTIRPMRAHLLKRIWRPDGRLSRLRGNFQTLSNGNAFIGWSDNSYMSEHAPDGKMVMTANFRSDRFVTYRSYRFNFTGAPTEPPVLKAVVHGDNAIMGIIAYYVSWNGATEVAKWNIYQSGDPLVVISSAQRTGFETVLYSQGYQSSVYAEAVSVNGESIGYSGHVKIAMPKAWAEGGKDYVAEDYIAVARTEEKSEL